MAHHQHRSASCCSQLPRLSRAPATSSERAVQCQPRSTRHRWRPVWRTVARMAPHEHRCCLVTSSDRVALASWATKRHPRANRCLLPQHPPGPAAAHPRWQQLAGLFAPHAPALSAFVPGGPQPAAAKVKMTAADRQSQLHKMWDGEEGTQTIYRIFVF